MPDEENEALIVVSNSDVLNCKSFFSKVDITLNLSPRDKRDGLVKMVLSA